MIVNEKNWVKGVLILGAMIFTLIATSVSASACIWGTYQPEEPECLREE